MLSRTRICQTEHEILLQVDEIVGEPECVFISRISGFWEIVEGEETDVPFNSIPDVGDECMVNWINWCVGVIYAYVSSSVWSGQCWIGPTSRAEGFCVHRVDNCPAGQMSWVLAGSALLFDVSAPSV